ncbi:MAG: ATP-dependent DNA helicase RecQ, partial [Treponema sp.]|nr:ATP-dependent DNA helicase RecQ [Treponema sp.]
EAEREEAWRKLESGESRLAIANPEVLLTERTLRRLAEAKSGRARVAHVVIDEAHCVGEWGDSFRPAYLEIGRIIEAAGAPVVTAFTATAGAQTLEKINKYIFGAVAEGDERSHLIMGNPDRPNISYHAQGCVAGNLAVRDIVLRNARPAIVFCSSRLGTEKLARYLSASLREVAAGSGAGGGPEARFYHAGLGREERAAVEKWFMESPDAVLCATCAYGMGVDKANVRTIVHRDCPPSIEAYLQESGRAGRDGAPSRAFLLWGPQDEASMRRAKTDADRARISALIACARDSGRCRRRALLTLLGCESEEAPEGECCDVCSAGDDAGAEIGRLREEASLLDFFARNGMRYTLSQAARELSGKEGFSLSEKEARQAVAHLVSTGALRESALPFWKGRLRRS